jgi:hypothetical protein
MTYTREPVRMSGTLHGQGQTATCTVSATRVTLQGTRLSQDCQYAIDWVSQPLPEGDYKLALEGEGRTVDMRLSEGGWRVTVLRLGQSINWEPQYGPQSYKSPERPKQSKPQKFGRPRLTKALAMGSIVRVWFSSEDRERIEAAAKASSKTISEWIRSTLLATMGSAFNCNLDSGPELASEAHPVRYEDGEQLA